jgi:hypothetical protein
VQVADETQSIHAHVLLVVATLATIPALVFFVRYGVGRMNTNDAADHAAELGTMDLDFVVVAALPQALAMRQAVPKMPMVIITCPGMVNRPGNIGGRIV